MKKTNKKERIREIRLTRRRTARHRERARQARRRRQVLAGFVEPHVSERKNERFKLRAPGRIDLYSDKTHRQTALFLRRLRVAALLSGKRVTIDFSGTTQVTAAAMLLTLAEIERIWELHPHPRPITIRMPRDDVVSQVFQQIGLYKLLGITRTVEVNHEDVTFWQYVSGSTVDGAAVGTFLERHVLDQLPENIELYEGVSEAMDNAVEHAAIRPRPDSIPTLEGRWWMFAGVHKNRLVLVLADLGIGIPCSVPVKWDEKVLAAIAQRLRLRRNTDGPYIRLAMELSRTRTDKRNRGLGMRELRDVLDQAGGGFLSVYSNRGGYSYHPTERQKEKIRSFKTSIMGTIIEWSLPLARAEALTIRDTTWPPA